MKNTGTCPKCQSRDVVRGARSGYSGIHSLGFFFFGGTTDVYVCKDCGYVEEYLIEKHLKKIQR